MYTSTLKNYLKIYLKETNALGQLNNKDVSAFYVH